MIETFLLLLAAFTCNAQPLSGQSVYNLDAPWVTQDGVAFQLSQLQGQPAVLAMVYTSCQGACPMTIADLKRIERGLDEKTRSHMRFAIFSFDSERDTPARLKKFAAAHELDPSHWTLLHGKPAAVRKLAAVLGIRFKKDRNGDFDHSNVITVVDAEGVIRYQQIGLGKDPKEAIEKLRSAEH